MSEFINRIDAQRAILAAVNQRTWDEELLGLSSQAIERWMASNRIDNTAEIGALLRTLADKLAFLANKSQEHLSDEYLLGTAEVIEMTKTLPSVLDRVRS
jgi:hypothetical protein